MFRDIGLKSVYTSEDDICNVFYEPVLRNAVTFDRTTAYFSAKALASYSKGLEFFSCNGNKYRLIISKDISEEDYQEIKKGYDLRKQVTYEMVTGLQEPLSLNDKKNLSNLAYFIAKGTIDIKIAFKTKGIFHDKCGILTDRNGDIICFRGSNNETEAAIMKNYESFQVTCSWIDSAGFYMSGIKQSQIEFDKLWGNKCEDVIVLPAEKVIINEILKYNKGRLIVEEIMIKEDSVILDYDGQLKLYINKDSIEWFLEKTFYKTQMKHKVERIDNKILVFSSDLSYPDYIKIDSVLSKKMQAYGINYYTTDRLKEYISERDLKIRKRANLGIELKTDSTRLDERYIKFKQVVDNNMVRRLRDKQMQDAFFMFAMMKSGNFSVPGSGKTSAALAVFCFLKYKRLADKVVMIGPKNSFGSWIDEFKECFGEKLQLKCFNIQDSQFHSAKERRYALKLNSGDCNLFLFNYESIVSYIDEIKHIIASKSLLVFDEVHKVKAIHGQRASYALEIAKSASYTIAMTGTPIPNTYMDLYNLLHILYNDEYRDYFDFDISFLRDPRPTDIAIINERIQPFFCRTTKKELNVPDANEDVINKVIVTKTEQRIFEIINKKYTNNKLTLFIRMLQMESNPQMLLQAINLNDFSEVLNLADDIDEIDFVDYSIEIRKLIDSVGETSKKKACIDLVKELVNQKKKVIIWCIFKDSIKGLYKTLREQGIKAKYIMGEVKLEERNQLINEFRNNRYDALITNPHTLAESVSLHTVAHDAIYYEYSYNLVHLLQSKDRIHRLGLPSNQYTQYYYIQDFFDFDGEKYSLDEKIYVRLLEKETIMLNAIDNQELEPVYTPDEDLDILFGSLL